MSSGDAGAYRFSDLLFTMYVVVLLAVSVPFAWLVLLLLPAGRRADLWSKGWARWLMAASGCPMTVAGAEHIPADRPVVFVSNHISYLDSIVLMAAITRPYRFAVARNYTAWPVVGSAIRKAGYVTVDRRTAATRAGAVEVLETTLRHGESVLVYPEGHRARGKTLDPFHAGAFRAAAATGSAIVPIAVLGTRAVMPRHLRLLRRAPIEVIVHPPLVPAADDRREVARLRDAARSLIERATT